MTTPIPPVQSEVAGDRQSHRQYGDADGYDRFMGRWSAALAPPFLQFALAGEPAVVLDIGCGTGNLLSAAASGFPRARLLGIDPSARLLAKARVRPELARVEFINGVAERLPFVDRSFDCTLSLLVLQEFSDRPRVLGEMRRVTRVGGIVAACQWDFSRMPVINTLVEAIGAIAPEASARIANSPRVFADERELRQHWSDAGFDGIATGRIDVVQEFQDMDELWLPLLNGSTPSTMVLASLPATKRAAVRQLMERRFPRGSSDTPLAVTASALVVRGRA